MPDYSTQETVRRPIAGLGSIKHLLHSAQVQMPLAHETFKQAQRVETDEGVQGALDLDA